MSKHPKRRAPRLPSLRRHRPSQRAVVTLNNVDHYLGAWPNDLPDPPPEAQSAYDRLIADWWANRCQPIPTPEECKRERLAGRDPDKASDCLTVAELVLRPLNHLYGTEPAESIGPVKLKAVRELMLKGDDHPEYGQQPALCRRVINSRIQRLTQCFKWAVGEELIGVEVYHALKAVAGLKKNRTTARESEPVRPVSTEDVEGVLPRLTLRLAGAVRLQMHTGARPGEALAVRLVDIDRTSRVWQYRPHQHKTAHHDKDRSIAIGPKGQAVLREFIRICCPICGTQGRPPRVGSPDGCLCGPCADRMTERGICGPWQRIEVQPADASLFSPAEAMAERDEDRRAKRKSKVQPSQMCRKKPKAKRRPGEVYGTRA